MGSQVDFAILTGSCVIALHTGTSHNPGGIVTDRIYIAIACLILALVVGDVLLNQGDGSMFMIRKLFHLVEYLEFWR